MFGDFFKEGDFGFSFGLVCVFVAAAGCLCLVFGWFFACVLGCFLGWFFGLLFWLLFLGCFFGCLFGLLFWVAFLWGSVLFLTQVDVPLNITLLLR